MQKTSSNGTTSGKLSGGYEPHLLRISSTYIDCCHYDKAMSILDFLAARGRLDKAMKEQHMVLTTMVLFHLAEYKRCANTALKLYKQTANDSLQMYLLLTINKCFVAMNGPNEAKKYLKAYLKKLKKYEK